MIQYAHFFIILYIFYQYLKKRPNVSCEHINHFFSKQASSNLQVNQEFAEDIETNSNNLHGGHITAIFAGVLAVVCIAIYVGLISWRSYLE